MIFELYSVSLRVLSTPQIKEHEQEKVSICHDCFESHRQDIIQAECHSTSPDEGDIND